MSTAKKPAAQGRLWIRLIRGHRTVGDLTLLCDVSHPQEALREAMHELDLSVPEWLPRHETDWQQFRLTRFTQDHFMDAISFDRMELSYIPSEEELNARDPSHEPR